MDLPLAVPTIILSHSDNCMYEDKQFFLYILTILNIGLIYLLVLQKTLVLKQYIKYNYALNNLLNWYKLVFDKYLFNC